PLVGVFLTDAVPQSPAPSTLNFLNTGLSQDFLSLSPTIGQVFFVGDGLANGNTTQKFFIPAGATRLFLGFSDAPNQVGLPGAYADNTGSLNVGVTAVPEPSSFALLLAALLAVTTARRRMA